MFWKGKQLATALNSVGQLYPNLFSAEISDLHSYRSNCKIFKTNCYATYFDLISGKRNSPVVFQNFGLQLINSLIETNGLRDIYGKLNSVRISVDEFFLKIIKQVDSAEWESGSVRAEFRVRLCDFNSLTVILNHLFNESNIKCWTLSFTSASITRLAKFYIFSLQKQLMSNLLQILAQFDQKSIQSREIMERIATISLLESLVSKTLFSGLTYGFASEVVWNKSTAEKKSIELMKGIKIKNRLVFPVEFFRGSNFKITAPGEVLDFIFKKINRNQVFNFPPVELIIKFNMSQNNQERSDFLWKIYFSELNANAFLDNGNPRWKLAAINRDTVTEFNIDKLQCRGAMRAVFNLEKLKLYNSWKNKYYLKLVQDWMSEKKGPTRETLDNLLLESMETLGIEHIHYVGNENYNGNSRRHLQIDWNSVSRLSISAGYNSFLSERDTRLIARAKNGEPTQWLDHDMMILVEGVNKYQSMCKEMFRYIHDDFTLKFKFRKDEKKIKTKWNNLIKSGDVRKEGERWIMPSLIPYSRTYPFTPTSPQIQFVTSTSPVVPRQPSFQQSNNGASDFSDSSELLDLNDFDNLDHIDRNDQLSEGQEMESEQGKCLIKRFI